MNAARNSLKRIDKVVTMLKYHIHVHNKKNKNTATTTNSIDTSWYDSGNHNTAANDFTSNITNNIVNSVDSSRKDTFVVDDDNDDEDFTTVEPLLQYTSGGTSNRNNKNIDSSIATSNDPIYSIISSAIQAFEAAMCDDMNTPKATAALFMLITATEKHPIISGRGGIAAVMTTGSNSISNNNIGSISNNASSYYHINDHNVTNVPNNNSSTAAIIARKILDAIIRMDRIFGLLYQPNGTYFKNDTVNNYLICQQPLQTQNQPNSHGAAITISTINIENNDSDNDAFTTASKLALKRFELKLAGRYQEADALRTQIAVLGYGVKDDRDCRYQLHLLTDSNH